MTTIHGRAAGQKQGAVGRGLASGAFGVGHGQRVAEMRCGESPLTRVDWKAIPHTPAGQSLEERKGYTGGFSRPPTLRKAPPTGGGGGGY